MNKISFLQNPIHEYAWGSKTQIQNLIKASGFSDTPMAELWMGAHPKAPSKVLVDGKWQPLDTVIEKNPEAILGNNIAKRFFNQLPFLFKVLAAERPLSVQVHPNREQARKGFAKENDLGIPLDGATRNYRDNEHKPEILCALAPFQGLKGFRTIEEILDLVGNLGLATLSHELDILKKSPGRRGLKSFFSAIMRMNKTRQEEVSTEAVRCANRLLDTDVAYQWVVELSTTYAGDIGILCPLMLNPVLLEPGEAIYLPAGELHAYLHGLGIELMANSDNVLRGGLTPKHMDVPELLNIVNFEPGPVKKVLTTSMDTCRIIYETPAEEFLLSMISVDERSAFTSHSDRSVEIMICLKGKAKITNLENNEVLPISRGNSVIIPSQIPRYRIEGNAELYMASVPL